jgi:hypothetical protein
MVEGVEGIGCALEGVVIHSLVLCRFPLKTSKDNIMNDFKLFNNMCNFGKCTIRACWKQLVLPSLRFCSSSQTTCCQIGFCNFPH